MAVESKRGCGFRKVGGKYLVAGSMGISCGRLPFELTTCPTCSHGIKQARGWTWVDGEAIAEVLPECKNPPLAYAPIAFAPACSMACPLSPIGALERGEPVGLLWVGEKYYPTPEHFMHEGNTLGISKRISAVPRGFKVGETWVLLGHPKCIPSTFIDEDTGKEEQEMAPGIFAMFKPTAIEVIVTDVEAKDEAYMERIEKQGLTPVIVPAGDKDHQN